MSGDATFSFELYPPRNPSAEVALFESLEHLIAVGPEFISVTYGANGSSRATSLALLTHLMQYSTFTRWPT